MIALNATHDSQRRSWVTTANLKDADFPIQNLPFGRFRNAARAAGPGVAIGDQVLDLRALADGGFLEGTALAAARAACSEDLAPLLRLGLGPAGALREALSDLLRVDGPSDKRMQAAAGRLLVPADAVAMLLPVQIRQFTDMCVSTFHIGRRRGVDANGQPLCPPAFRTIPIGYDGRASSVTVSGADVRRPNGTWQTVPDGSELDFGPEPRQDYELELAIWLGGPGNAPGEPIPISGAGKAIFGYGLVNDWSARGIQMWETMLGPFLGKSLATSVSPWIVTAEALAPFRTGAFVRPDCDPPVPPHLRADTDQAAGGLDLKMEAFLVSEAMAASGAPAFQICETNFKHMYWTPAQMVAHHSSNGCALAAGDLLGSGTASGPELEAAGCLIERTMKGALRLPGGEERMWLEDGDTVILRGRAERSGYVSIGLGEVRGKLLAAVEYPHQPIA